MTAVHNEPHPMAQQYVLPSNPEIAKKFGAVRIEDWDDRIAENTWLIMRVRGNQDASSYAELASSMQAPMTGLAACEVVRCHTQRTGELVLLHDDWLKGAQVIT